MANDLLDQLAQSYVNAIVTGQREPNYLQVPYYLRPPAEALNQNALTEGTIRNASWLDFNPIAKSALDTFMEASGAAPSARLVDRLVKLQSPVLRPQSAYGWADWGAGAAADTIQTGLAGADLAAMAPLAGKRFVNALTDQSGVLSLSDWAKAPRRGGLQTAWEMPDGKIIESQATHFNVIEEVIDYLKKIGVPEDKFNYDAARGFVDSKGNFLSREQATKILDSIPIDVRTRMSRGEIINPMGDSLAHSYDLLDDSAYSKVASPLMESLDDTPIAATQTTAAAKITDLTEAQESLSQLSRKFKAESARAKRNLKIYAPKTMEDVNAIINETNRIIRENRSRMK